MFEIEKCIIIIIENPEAFPEWSLFGVNVVVFIFKETIKSSYKITKKNK